MESLFYVYHNLKTYPWPIIIFHTGAFDQNSLRLELKIRLMEHILFDSYRYANRQPPLDRTIRFIDRLVFERIIWELPAALPAKADLEPIAFDWLWPGYHHMCNFYAYELLRHPLVQNLTYYLRLDTDSYIYAPLCYDPFERMQKRKLKYAYRLEEVEEPWVMGTFWETLDDYVELFPEIKKTMEYNGFVTPSPDRRETTNMDIWWNNFEIVRLDAFRRPDIQHWLETLESMPEKIYKYRWGK